MLSFAPISAAPISALLRRAVPTPPETAVARKGWVAIGPVPYWISGRADMAGGLVRNKVQRSPADDSPCYIDFGDCSELAVGGVTVTSCTATEVGTTALTIGTPTVETNGYRVAVTITGGTDGAEYTIRFYATLSNGKHIERNAKYLVTA